MAGASFIKNMKFAFVSALTATITFSVLYSFRSAHQQDAVPIKYDAVPNNAQIIRSLTQNNSSQEEKPTQRHSDTASATLTESLANTVAVPDDVSTELKTIHTTLYGFTENSDSKFFLEPAPNEKIEDCPAIPKNLVGEIKVYFNQFPMSELNKVDWHLKPGGSYAPQYCNQTESVAIVIPFRKREEHLAVLLLNLHTFLQKQQRDYTIFVVNQIEGSKFNRAMLMNIGFWEAMKKRKYDCIIFHDVDLIPENDRNIYNCPNDNPRHMSVAVDKFKYQLPYANILGGIVAVRWDIMMVVNGYSNQFFGWGGEDDDFSARMRSHKYIVTRYPNKIARYKMIKHNADAGNEPNKERFNMLKHVQRREDHDGINSLKYTLKSVEKFPLYTQLNVEINQSDVMNAPRHSLADFPYTSDIWIGET